VVISAGNEMTSEYSSSGHEQRKAVPFRTYQVRAFRYPILLDARAAFNEGKSTFDCQIRNISTTGAQLAIANLASLPDEEFLLVVPARNKTYRVEFRWRSNNLAGVRFLAEINAEEVEALTSLGSSVEEPTRSVPDFFERALCEGSARIVPRAKVPRFSAPSPRAGRLSRY
jgi:hypothetical protein